MFQRIKSQLAVAVAAGICAAGFAAPSLAQEKLTVWFTKGFYPAEDIALDEVVKKFEAKTGVKVELSRYAIQEIIPKSVAALDAGNPPDVSFGHTYDFQVTSKWAYDGKLEDISDVMTPIKGIFLPNTAETTFLYNAKAKKAAYYAFPLEQQTMHINYWKDMLAEAGFKESDIPTQWKPYWDFWCDKVQPAYRKKTGKKVYAIGNPMGVDSTDSFYSFLTFADAHGVQMVDNEGRLRFNDPKVRAGLIGALRDYTGLYTRGCTPPSSTSWKDPDNNVAFHNKGIIMTHNATISIATKHLDDMNNATLTGDQRAQAKKNYEELIATSGFPNRPDGSPMKYRAAVKTGVVFDQAKNKKRAKEFVAFLLQDENAIPFVEGALGRWYPVTKSGVARTNFWLSDPQRATVQRQFIAGTNNFEFAKNYRFTVLNNENVWAKAMNRVINDKLTVEKAVDEMIARIKEVAGS
jgi:multiple sugar transport system substrate-binding protein